MHVSSRQAERSLRSRKRHILRRYVKWILNELFALSKPLWCPWDINRISRVLWRLVLSGVVGKLLQISRPPCSNSDPFVPMRTACIGFANLISFDMGKRTFDCISAPETGFVRQSGKGCAKAMGSHVFTAIAHSA